MKLQEKTFLVILSLLIVVLIAVSVFYSTIILASYSTLEEQYIQKDLDQAVNKFHDELLTMSNTASDWGPWDDTVDFVNGNDPDYLHSNLQPYGFDNLDLNLIVITNTRGEVLYSGAYDLMNKTMVPVPAFFSGPLDPKNPLMNMSDPHHATGGIVMLPEAPMLVVSQPIMYSNFSGSPHGVIIMGRYINRGEISRLAELTQPSLAFVKIEDPALPPDLVSRIRKNAGPAAGVTLPLNADQIAGYTLIKDIYGNDALVLEISESRDIYRQGISTTMQVIIIILAAGLFLGLGVIFLLDRAVLSRLRSLADQVNTIGKSGISTTAVKIEGDDELSGLAMEINHMLGMMEKAHDSLMQSEARFHELADLLPQIIFEMDVHGILLYVNHAGLKIFGIDDEKIRTRADVLEYLIPEDHERMQRGLAQVMDGAKSSGEIYHLKRMDGTLMSAIVYTSPVHRNGMVAGFRGIVIDITDRVKLEEALMESQDYLQTLLWSVKVGIVVIDAETHRIIDANPAAVEMIGTPKDQIINHVCHRFICPTEKGHCPITDLNRSVDNAERELITPSGNIIPIIKYVVPVKLHGKVCLLETFIDNTARKKIEHDLRESTELLTGILQASPVGVFRLDISGNVIFVNEMFTKITGITQDRIRGTFWVGILHPDDQGPVLGKLADAIGEKKMVMAEARFIHANGQVYWLHGYVVPLISPEGSIDGWVGTIDDITQQKLIEDALRESEEKYRAITENTPDVLFSTDLTGIITYASPQVNKYGFLVEEVIGKPLRMFIHPADIGQVEGNLSRELKEKAQFTSQFRILDKWGSTNWFEEKSTLRLDHKGKPIGIYGILRDVTERKRVEDAIDIANKKLNLMNQITRHDILNTLTGLYGCVDMAKATPSPEGKDRLLEDIRELTRVIQRHISFTREYQEVGVHLPQWQNVNDIIRNVLQNFTKSGIIFSSEFEKTEIYADPLLEKVFYNLVDNAIRYGETLTTISIYPTISDKGFSLVFEDDGVGVEQEKKREIFKRGVGKNTGMGLFLTAEILAITGITIEENGIFGKGARFEIRIPNGTWRLLRD